MPKSNKETNIRFHPYRITEKSPYRIIISHDIKIKLYTSEDNMPIKNLDITTDVTKDVEKERSVEKEITDLENNSTINNDDIVLDNNEKKNDVPIAIEDSDSDNVYGRCCFCHEQCNPCSQCCGRCARNGYDL